MTWRLDNAEERAKTNPATFELLPLSGRKDLVVGDYAKLTFVQDEPPAGERMWVEVTKRTPVGYEGEVNTPAVTMDIPEKTLVSFGPEHVLVIQRGDTVLVSEDHEAN